MRVSERRMQLRLPGDLYQQLRALAQQDASTISAVVRRLLAVGVRAELQGGTR